MASAMTTTSLPRSLTRRLQLAMAGYRCRDGMWCGPGPLLTEEQVDAMSAQAWSRYIRRWRRSAATN